VDDKRTIQSEIEPPERDDVSETDQAQSMSASDGPPGNSAVEIAARKGFGPLSSLISKIWHGDSQPCVSCGQLNRRDAKRCDSCEEDLSSDMIGRMSDYAGPWRVLEHVRPFPGVTCERLVRQVRRGVLTRSTIVSGPTTDFQWRFAGETPGLSKYLGICWNCFAQASWEQSQCPACKVDLGELTDELPKASNRAAPAGGQSRSATGTGEISQLARIVKGKHRQVMFDDDAPRVGSISVAWIITGILVFMMAVLLVVVRMRNTETHPPPSPESVVRVDDYTGQPVDV
jgi:RNA polymerase subunit RPABC4/transcription elongation factor Spt4